MLELFVKYVLLLTLALAAPASLAQGIAPDALLRAVAAEVTDRLRQNQDFQATDPVKIAALVETKILPLFDFVHMTRLAVSRNWRLATPEQQRVLTEEFKMLLDGSRFNSIKTSFWEKSRVMYAIFQDVFRGGRQ
jgi:phospholipid transport system substrate-binding protein